MHYNRAGFNFTEHRHACADATSLIDHVFDPGANSRMLPYGLANLVRVEQITFHGKRSISRRPNSFDSRSFSSRAAINRAKSSSFNPSEASAPSAAQASIS